MRLRDKHIQQCAHSLALNLSGPKSTAVNFVIFGCNWKSNNISPRSWSLIKVFSSIICKREFTVGKQNDEVHMQSLSLFALAWKPILQSCTVLSITTFGMEKYLINDLIQPIGGTTYFLLTNLMIFFFRIAFLSGLRGGYHRLAEGPLHVYITLTPLLA
jgi:hypothetical protein